MRCILAVLILSTSALLMARGGHLVTQAPSLNRMKLALGKNKINLLSSSIFQRSKVPELKQERQTLQQAITLISLIEEQPAYIEENGELLDEIADLLVASWEFVLLKEAGWFYYQPATEEHYQAYQLMLTAGIKLLKKSPDASELTAKLNMLKSHQEELHEMQTILDERLRQYYAL